ncbi:ribonuclease BN [candidate division KSB3 bacterium]|uniref:Ribonuclease BN n=1 Tax=candidate division KSB3 bacterium TaxID=2044937 RepID=A0A2G6K9A6_9BACT|nr:MAG: ribonuclease BN [candidate division KSB3 bacterium]
MSIQEIITLLLHKIPTQTTSRLNTLLWNALKILLLAIRSFYQNRGAVRASALTLYSLLAVVPVLALAFGIAKGFGLEKMLERQLLENIPGQENGLLYIIDFARKLLENTQGGLIAGIGVTFLLWSVVKVLGNIESSLNHIWKITEGRSLSRKFSDYLSLTLIAPLLAIISSSVSVFITTQVTTITEQAAFLEVFSPLIFSSLKLLPFGLIWILFSFLYIFLPNTTVRFIPGVLAGIIAGTIYQFVQGGYIYFQIKISNYNAIYGSFAALPFFILWLQISWLIVLFGAEISFYCQNLPATQDDYQYDELASSLQKILGLRVTHLLVINFLQGERPFTLSKIAQRLELSPSLIQQILTRLVDCHILSRVILGEQDNYAYQPAQSIERLSVQSVMAALEHDGIHDIVPPKHEDFTAFFDITHQFDALLETCSANKLLKDISLADTSSADRHISVKRGLQ